MTLASASRQARKRGLTRVTDNILAYIERHREAQSEGPTPMDIGTKEGEDNRIFAGVPSSGGAEDPYAGEQNAWNHPQECYEREEPWLLKVA